MLFLVFQLGRDRYALDASQVVEVIPLVRIKALPQSPRGVAGLCNYRGAPVPVIDLCALALDRPSLPRLSTRLVLVGYPDARGERRVLGLMAEQATGMVRWTPDDFGPSGVDNPAAPYLGPVAADGHGIVQRVELDRLLTPAVRDLLFNEPSVANA